MPSDRHSFLCTGIDPTPYLPLFALNDADLIARGARRVVADADDAYPCRVALERVRKGEELLLVHYMHQTNPHSPYRSGGPVFVSRSAGHPAAYRDELPPAFRDRLLSLRAYDGDALIVDAEVAEGAAVMVVIDRFLADPGVHHVDAHFARRGCFAGRISRA